jgi:hypothetical protein
VEIYDLSAGSDGKTTMPGTSAALAKKFGVKVQIGAPVGFTSRDGASFVVVVGPGLANSSSSSATTN